MIVRDTKTDTYVGIACDKCDAMAPTAREITAGHGLVHMGWYCSGGQHICPDHEHPAQGWPERPALPQAITR